MPVSHSCATSLVCDYSVYSTHHQSGRPEARRTHSCPSTQFTSNCADTGWWRTPQNPKQSSSLTSQLSTHKDFEGLSSYQQTERQQNCTCTVAGALEVTEGLLFLVRAGNIYGAITIFQAIYRGLWVHVQQIFTPTPRDGNAMIRISQGQRRNQVVKFLPSIRHHKHGHKA